MTDLKEKVGAQNASIQVLKAENTMMKERLSFLQRMCEASGLNLDTKLSKPAKSATVVMFVLFSCMLMSVPFASMLCMCV